MIPGTTRIDTGIRNRFAPHSANADSVAALANPAAKRLMPVSSKAEYIPQDVAPANPAGTTLLTGTRNKTANAATPKNAATVSTSNRSSTPSQP